MTAVPRSRAGRAASLALGALIVVGALAGCTPAPGPAPSGAPSVSSSSVQPSAPAAPAPVLVPGGTAEQNKAFFDATNAAVVTADSGAGGRAFIDALVTAGFDKAAMEVTSDTTSIGLDADSVQFAVKVGEDCLVGQYGPKSGGYHGIIAKPIATGRCLVGQTVTIDW